MDIFKTDFPKSNLLDILNLISVRLKFDYENSLKKNMKCDIHSSNNMCAYCQNCREKICSKCEGNHEKHSTTDKDEIVLLKIEALSNLIEKFCGIKSDINDVMVQCDKQKNSIYIDQKECLDKIDVVFEELQRELNRFKNDLLQELQQVVESCLDRISKNKLELNALHDDVSTITELVVRQNSAFEHYDLFELEEYTSQKLNHYTQMLPLDHLRPNELSIQVKWTDSIRNIIKQPLAKINCHISPERLSFLQTISTHHNSDKQTPFISSVCCDKNDTIYLCDTSNKKVKVMTKEYVMEKWFFGTGKYKLTSPTIVLPLDSSSTRPGNESATVIVCDPGSTNVVTFTHSGQGVDLFVTTGKTASMCTINDLNELSNLQENSLELSPIYTSIDHYESQEFSPEQHAIVLCTKLDSLFLEFLQVNPVTLKLYKSRSDLTLSFIDNNNETFFPKCIVWNHVSKFFFLLDNLEYKVLIFSGQDGRFIRFYGRYGEGYGEFRDPSNIIVDRDGYVLISDMLNHRIHVLDSLGNFLKFLFPYTHKHSIFQPTAMCFDNNDNLVICQADGKMKIFTYY